MSRPYDHPQEHGQGSFSSCLEKVIFSLILVLGTVILVGVASGNADHSGCAVSDRYPMEVRQWCEPITRFARENHLPPDLVAALIWYESGGNPSAYSSNGAVGLMQVMPSDGIAASFRCKGAPCFQDRPTTQELQDGEFNIRYGTNMLSDLVQEFGGSYREALKLYGPINAGYTYADTVLAIYRQYSK